MMKEWYYRVDEDTLGPVTQEELLNLIESEELKKYTAVKNDTMETWREARSLDILFPVEEQSKKLPLFPTIKKAFHLTIEKAPLLWNKLFVISLLLMATNMIILTQENVLGQEVFFWTAIAINLIVGTMFVITIHRVVLLEPTKVSMAGTSWSGKEWKFIFYSIGFYFLISLTTIVPMLLVLLGGQHLIMLFLMNQVTMYLGLFFLILIVWYISVRLSLIFPAIAVEKEEASFNWAMNTSSGNGWRLMVVLFSVPFILAYIIPQYYGISLMMDSLLELIRTILSIFEIVLLSVSFQYLSDFKETD